MHWGNDGLWFPQDAPRHLVTGIFFKDYLSSGFPPPSDYYRSYLVRYPIISPDRYPPGFYLLEALAFLTVNPSARLAKSLVLGFALLAAIYQVAWLRRFVDPMAGYLGAVLPLVPCIVQYSHAILLNVPALALQLAALYHARCWLGGTARRHLLLAAAFGVAALFFYQGAMVLLLIVGTWLIITGRWRSVLNRNALIVAAPLLLLSIVPIIWIIWTADQARWLYDIPYIGHRATWLWYPRRMPEGFGRPLLAGAALGALAGLCSRRWHSELLFSGGWIAVTYLFHTYLFGKDLRYMLPLCTPLLSLTAVAVWAPLELLRARIGSTVAQVAMAAAIATLLAMHLFAPHRSKSLD